MSGVASPMAAAHRDRKPPSAIHICNATRRKRPRPLDSAVRPPLHACRVASQYARAFANPIHLFKGLVDRTELLNNLIELIECHFRSVQLQPELLLETRLVEKVHNSERVVIT